MKLKPFRQHVLRAYQEHGFTIQCKEIRTFPHFSVSVFILCQNADKLPVKTGFTGIQKNLSASVFRAVTDHAIKQTVLALPDLRITKINSASSGRNIFFCENRIVFYFFIIQSIPDSQSLSLNVLFRSILLDLMIYSCVDQKLPSVRKLSCTSGKTSYMVIILIRCKSCRKIFPVKQILAHRMSPMHTVPLCLVWIILIEQMILSLIPGKTIGVIHPSNVRS